jgi:hypothetical protein
MASPVHSLDHIGFVNAQRSQPQTDRIGHPCLFHDRFRQSELVFLVRLATTMTNRLMP